MRVESRWRAFLILKQIKIGSGFWKLLEMVLDMAPRVGSLSLHAHVSLFSSDLTNGQSLREVELIL